MEYKVIFLDEKLINKDLSKIQVENRKIIFEKLRFLGDSGLTGNNIKKLVNYSQADFRLRVGNYRILFDIDEEKKLVKILRILHRSKLY